MFDQALFSVKSESNLFISVFVSSLTFFSSISLASVHVSSDIVLVQYSRTRIYLYNLDSIPSALLKFS